MDITMQEFINILRIKNQLIMFSGNELIEIYKNEEDFLCFIDTFVLLTEVDSAFLLFDERFSDKICTLLQDHRFNCDSEIKQSINDIISYLNGIRGYSKGYINILKNSYLSYQEQMRQVEFSTTEAFLASMANDAIVFSSLQDGELDKIEDGDYYMMSLNYFMKVCPELFENCDVLERASSLLDKEFKSSRILSKRKKYVKETRERLNNASKKEE